MDRALDATKLGKLNMTKVMMKYVAARDLVARLEHNDWLYR